MEKITIEINTTNSAFDEGKEYEVVRILRELADKIESDNIPNKLHDINGNVVGMVVIQVGEDDSNGK